MAKLEMFKCLRRYLRREAQECILATVLFSSCNPNVTALEIVMSSLEKCHTKIGWLQMKKLKPRRYFRSRRLKGRQLLMGLGSSVVFKKVVLLHLKVWIRRVAVGDNKYVKEMKSTSEIIHKAVVVL